VWTKSDGRSGHGNEILDTLQGIDKRSEKRDAWSHDNQNYLSKSQLEREQYHWGRPADSAKDSNTTTTTNANANATTASSAKLDTTSYKAVGSGQFDIKQPSEASFGQTSSNRVSDGSHGFGQTSSNKYTENIVGQDAVKGAQASDSSFGIGQTPSKTASDATVGLGDTKGKAAWPSKSEKHVDMAGSTMTTKPEDSSLYGMSDSKKSNLSQESTQFTATTNTRAKDEQPEQKKEKSTAAKIGEALKHSIFGQKDQDKIAFGGK
jgi:hypothetical protein